METKEHLFLVTWLLALYLPIAAYDKVLESRGVRKMVLSATLLVVFTGLFIEGAGGIIDHGVKVALLRPSSRANAK